MAKTGIKDFNQVLHLALTTEHLSKYSGTLQCVGHVRHGRTIVRETSTPIKRGKFGTPSELWYFEDSPTSFKSLEELMHNYEIPKEYNDGTEEEIE